MPTTPVSFFTERSMKRKEVEHGLWRAWKEAPEEEKPEKIKPLLQAYVPTFKQREKLWKPPRIPSSAFQAALHTHFIGALDTWDPSKAALSTHVENRLQKALRYVNQNQNVGYIPEGQTQQIGKINRAVDELTEEYSRPPTDAEIGAHIGLTAKKVQTVRKAQMRDLPSSFLEGAPIARSTPREQEVFSFLRDELKPDEQKVFDHIFGLHGAKQITETGQLASQLGKNLSQISRIKNKIINKYKEYE